MAVDDRSVDPFWKGKRLTPPKLLVHDVALESRRRGREPRLELNEVQSSTLVDDTSLLVGSDVKREKDEEIIPIWGRGSSRSEQQRLKYLRNEFGWMNALRIKKSPEDTRMCRWIHVASKFPENLQGVLLGLSDWSVEPEAKVESLRQLDRAVYDKGRPSNHGRYFTPFFRPLGPSQTPSNEDSPLLISLPFLDWTVYPGPTPPLRFQVDERDQYYSSRSNSHPLRSILQYYYRLEDTTDRERIQVFAKHRPWHTNRDLDLKVRRWYGHYPSGLNVDEIWVLVVDSSHIVTFSANQTWKSRYPPLQLSARVSEVSFRGLRDHFFGSERNQRYSSTAHAIACLHGSIGMIHRSFWADMPLNCTDRYGGYLSHLQYRLHRSPSTKLVMDLLQVQDELNIILQITRRQEEVVNEFREYLASLSESSKGPTSSFSPDTQPNSNRHGRAPHDASVTFEDYTSSREEQAMGSYELSHYEPMALPRGATFNRSVAGRTFAFLPSNPINEVLHHLHRELDDLTDLRERSNELVNRTVQLVNIRLEDHGQAILVFTLVTIVFLPVNAVTSYFGMNTSDIRGMTGSSAYFWVSMAVLATIVVAITSFIAFYGKKVMEDFALWRAGRRRANLALGSVSGQHPANDRAGTRSRWRRRRTGSFGGAAPSSTSKTPTAASTATTSSFSVLGATKLEDGNMYGIYGPQVGMH